MHTPEARQGGGGRMSNRGGEEEERLEGGKQEKFFHGDLKGISQWEGGKQDKVLPFCGVNLTTMSRILHWPYGHSLCILCVWFHLFVSSNVNIPDPRLSCYK